jgi:hypothetical protein
MFDYDEMMMMMIIIIIIIMVIRQLPRGRVYEILQRMDDISLIFPRFTTDYINKKYFWWKSLHL